MSLLIYLKGGGDSPSDDNFLNALRANLEGDDDDDSDLDKKNKKNRNGSGSGGNISTMQAIDMIRSLLSEKTGKSESKAITANNSDRNEQTRSPVGFEADDDEFTASDAKQYESVSTKDGFKSIAQVSASTEMDVDASADEKTSSESDLRRDPSKKELDSAEDAAPIASSSSALVVVPGSTSHDVKLVRKASAKLVLDIDDEESSTVATTTTSNGVPLSSLDPNRYNNMSAVYDPPAVISGASMVCKLKDHR